MNDIENQKARNQAWLEFQKPPAQNDGVVRRGVIASDPKEALRRLEAIYGPGNVLDLKPAEKCCKRQCDDKKTQTQ